jgi:hypothetical protein
MKKAVLIINTSLLFAWNMQGFTTPSPAPETKTWCYQGTWKNNFNYGNYPQIVQIEGGEACWVYNQISVNSEKKDTYEWKEGWNFISPVFKNWNLDEKFRGNASIAWKYKNGKWKVYNYNINGIENFNELNIGEGMFVYIPEIVTKINNQALFCKNGECSEIITANKNYKFALKAPQNKDIKFAFDLYRFSNNTHYKFAIGPFKISDSQINGEIPVCVEKEGVGGSCAKINNSNEHFLNYNNGYLSIDSQKVANHFNKSIPNITENFLVKLYIEGFDLKGFIPEKFGTLGIEGFGTWVSLKNSKKIEFKLQLKD